MSEQGAELRLWLGQASTAFLEFARGRPLVGPRGTESLPAVVRESRGRTERRLLVSAEALVHLVREPALPWLVETVRQPELERPDLLAFGLEPLEGHFAAAREAAWALRDVLGRRGLRAFVKTASGRGLELLVPLRPDLRREPALAAGRALAAEAAARFPRLLALAWRKGPRRASVQLEVLDAIVAPYSPLPDGRVAAPLDWDELPALADRAAHRLDTLGARLAGGREPFAALFDDPHELGPVAQELAMLRSRRARSA